MRRPLPSRLQLPLRLSELVRSLPCAQCIAFPACGGHELPLLRAFGCIRKFSSGEEVDPDDMNPLNEPRFGELWDDVGGLLDFRVGRLVGAVSAAIPEYVPVLQHEGSRSRPPACEVVAIPLFQILRMRRDGSYGPRFSSAAELRRRFKLRPETQILLRGVDEDRMLERFWQYHRLCDVGGALAQLNVLGVTCPNFSFFTDATRFQVLRNRKRILLTCERLSARGVPMIPHLNALTEADWQFWTDFLIEHDEIEVVCKEFETGLKRGADGAEAYRQLVQLQEAVGRDLHPLLVAGGRFYSDAQRDFARATVMDSTAFMGAVNRQMLVADGETKARWVKAPTPLGAPIDDHFDQNVRVKWANFEDQTAEQASSSLVLDVEGQLYLDELMPKPYFTAQPEAERISDRQADANSELQFDLVSH